MKGVGAMKYLGWTLLLLLIFVVNYNISDAQDNLELKSSPMQNQNQIIHVDELNIGNSLREIIKDMKNQLISAQNEISNLQEINYNQKKSLAEKDNIIAIMQEQKTLLEKTLANNDEQSKKLTSESKQVSDLITSKDKKISELEDQNTAYKEQINALYQKTAGINDELEKAKAKITDSDEKEKLTASVNTELQNNIVFWRSKAENLEKKLADTRILNVNSANILNNAVKYLKEEKGTSSIFYFNLARAYQDAKDFPRAIENYKLALDNNPDFGKAYCQLGLAYAETGDYENSLKSFKNYLKYTNNSEEVDVVRGFIAKLEKSM